VSQARSYKTRVRIPAPTADMVHGQLDLEKNPALDLLRQAAEEAARRQDGTLGTSYSDCEGRSHRAWLSLHTQEFSRGVGLAIGQRGEVSFHYDNATVVNSELPELAGQVRFIYDTPDSARKLCDDTVSNYATLAAERALESLDCAVTVEKANNQEVYSIVRGRDALGRERAMFISPQGDAYADFCGFQGDDCVTAELALRQRLEAFGLELQTTWQRRKVTRAPAGFIQPREDLLAGAR
jgi:hypothetical protein